MYFLTTVEKLVSTPRFDGLFPKNPRTIGYYKELKDAEKMIENGSFLNETIYDYAAIEYFDEGIYPQLGYAQYYLYDYTTNQYNVIKPARVKELNIYKFAPIG